MTYDDLVAEVNKLSADVHALYERDVRRRRELDALLSTIKNQVLELLDTRDRKIMECVERLNKIEKGGDNAKG